MIVVDIAVQMETVPYAMATGEDLEETVQLVEKIGQRALGVTADVRSQKQLDDAVSQGLAEFGKIDILIANAGILSFAPFWEMSEQAWDEIIGVNLTGVWKSAKAVAPHMIAQSCAIACASPVALRRSWRSRRAPSMWE